MDAPHKTGLQLTINLNLTSKTIEKINQVLKLLEIHFLLIKESFNQQVFLALVRVCVALNGLRQAYSLKQS